MMGEPDVRNDHPNPTLDELKFSSAMRGVEAKTRDLLRKVSLQRLTVQTDCVT